MASGWGRALAMMDADLDAELGETVQVVPTIVSDYDGTRPDPDRPTFDVIALVHENEAHAIAPPGLRTEVQSVEFVLEIRRVVMPDVRLKKGDEVVLLDRPDAPRLVISRIDRWDESRIVMPLALIRKETP